MKKSVIYFGAPWCTPCSKFKPIVQQVSQETGTPVQYVDIDASPEIASMYQITSIPTLIIKDSSTGQILTSARGVVDKARLHSMLK
jgi:thioredoxin 1